MTAKTKILAATSNPRMKFWLWTVGAFLIAFAAATINPIGYLGSGADDEQYLAAARCWVAHGMPCIPQSHWWMRWPVFALIAALTSTLGESRLTVSIAPGLYWAASLVLIWLIGRVWFGWRAAAISTVMFGTIPIVALIAFDPNVDLPELVFQLLSIAFVYSAIRGKSGVLAFVGGLCAGIAMQARDTSAIFVFVAIVPWVIRSLGRREILLWALFGLAAVVAMDLILYWANTNDPFLHYRLAFGHARVPSFELPSGFHSRRGPLFNPDYIRSWKRDAGITFWWPIDPWLNLICSPRSTMILTVGVVAWGLFKNDLSSDHRRSARIMLGFVFTVSFLLIYGLAIDPKPRMFMLLWAGLALVIGALLEAGLRSSKWPFALALLLVAPASGLIVAINYPTSIPAEIRARRWIVNHGNSIELDKSAASYLTLLPEARRLPIRGAGRRFVMMTSQQPCSEMIEQHRGHPSGRVIDQVSGSKGGGNYLCLFEYLPVSASRR